MLDGVTLDVPAGHVGRARRTDRLRQVDADAPAPALHRAGRRHAWRSTVRTCRSVTLQSLRANIGIVFEDTLLFSDTIAANIAFGRPDATRGRDRPRRGRRAGARVHRGAARGLRHAGRRARLHAVRRAAAARRDRARDPHEPAHPDPRRRHVQRRRARRGGDPQGSAQRDGGPDDDHRRAPSADGGARRQRRVHGRADASSTSARTPTCGGTNPDYRETLLATVDVDAVAGEAGSRSRTSKERRSHRGAGARRRGPGGRRAFTARRAIGEQRSARGGSGRSSARASSRSSGRTCVRTSSSPSARSLLLVVAQAAALVDAVPRSGSASTRGSSARTPRSSRSRQRILLVGRRSSTGFACARRCQLGGRVRRARAALGPRAACSTTSRTSTSASSSARRSGGSSRG